MAFTSLGQPPTVNTLAIDLKKQMPYSFSERRMSDSVNVGISTAWWL